MKWLEVPFGRPSGALALPAAQTVRAESPQLAAGFHAARHYLESTGHFTVQIRELGRSGGTYSGLTSIIEQKFGIVLDPRPHFPGRYSEDSEAELEISFRLAHEVGHTLFYRCTKGSPPARARKVDADEEAFCDLFAAHLLVADARSVIPTAAELVAAAANRGIPRWVAAKAHVSVAAGAAAEWSRAGRLLWQETSGAIEVPGDLDSALVAPYVEPANRWSLSATPNGYLITSTPTMDRPAALAML